MVLVGAGGAGRGLAYGVKLLGGELLVADLDESEGVGVCGGTCGYPHVCTVRQGNQ